MRLVVAVAVTAACLGGRGDALADEPLGTDNAVKRMTFGIDKGIVVPIGGQGDFAGLGFGVLPCWEYGLSPRLAMTVNPGLVLRIPVLSKLHGPGVGNITTEFLLTGGIKHRVTPELGVRILTGLNVRTLWGSAKETNARGALILGGDYKVWRRWSLGADLFIPNLLFAEAGEDIETGILLTISHGFL